MLRRSVLPGVQIDLRGTGRSSPPGEPWDNTLFAIIEDIERLRTTLEIEKWAVAASSWGTTFALAYGESCPDACLAFVLCGVLLGTESEKAWLFEAGARFFPRAHEEFIVWIDASERDNALRAYEMALFSSDRSLQLLAAKRWRRYIAICSRINPAAAGGDHGSSRDDEVTTIAHARVHVHYASHNMYLAEQQLLAEVGRIAHLPAVLIQGSADILCPPRAADKLRRVWPSASMYIVPGVTSDPSNPGISNAVLQASESFRQNGRFK